MVQNRSLPRRHSLIAVVLVARLRPGPRLIFHYPPSPQRRPREDDWPEHSKYDSEPDPDAVDLPSSLTQSARDVQGISPTGTTDADNEENATGTLLGYSEDTLQKLLAPGCWADRKKFEVCLNGLTFVGHPVWAAQDGSWSRKHAHDDAGTKQESTPKTLGTSAASGSDTSVPTSPEPISMFNVVFVLDSARSNDNQQLASDLYNHVARKLSKALHYFQRQSQYVGLQTTTLLHLTAKARQDGASLAKLNVQAVDRSELAWVLKELYEKISIGEIAGIRLSGMEMSLQKPQVAPPERQDESELGPHSGLLLLQNKAALLLELTHADASPLVMFIQGHTPTKSMQKQSAKLGIPLDEVLGLARHLIKWRKARAIKPLHPRNTYVIGREAPFEQLQTYYIDDYSKRFPLLPSLPQILKVLNGKPIKWGALIMSSDHRTPYMSILAYLVQHRFVEQLKTYGWLQAP
ncbi:nitrogen permease regulator of amino acid transport activity 3-domain-containing protein, partial [Neohortaea acidophila]